MKKLPDVVPQNAKGMAIMAFGLFVFAGVDIQAKYLTQTLHPLQIVWVRQLGLLAVVVVLFWRQGPALLRTPHRGLQVARGVMAATSATLFIFAIRHVPIADAVAVSFVAPFIVTVLGALILREPVGLRRWAAVSLGFVGTLVVIRPGSGVMHPAVLLVVIAATAFAVRQILSRSLSADDGVATTVAYTALVSSALLTVPLPFVWAWPTSTLEVALLVSIAVFAAVGEVCIIWSLQLAQAVAVAPLMYTLIIWGTIYGYVVFGDLPDLWTWVGAAIIIASGLYTFVREARRSSQRGT